MTENNTEEAGWTKESLQKLFVAMKSNVPQRYIKCPYTNGLKHVDWTKVAFNPFSPEACQKKWGDILQKMRKFRSLAELIVEAEGVLSDPAESNKINSYFMKKPTPPNAMFYEENWAKFQEQHPELSHKEVVGLLGKTYKKLPDEEKARYIEKHKRATQEYNSRILELRKDDPKTPGRKHTKKRRSANQMVQDIEGAEGLPPKPPLNGYNLFCKEQVASMAGVSNRKYVNVWAKRWRDLTEIQKNEYHVRSRELKTQYATELNKYLKTMNKLKQQQIIEETGIKRVALRLPGEPKMPSRSGNVIFCKNQMTLLKAKYPNSKERFIKVNRRWQDLSTKEKEYYKDKVHENIRKYSMELQKWFETLTAADQEEYRTSNPTKCKYLNLRKTTMLKSEEQCPNRPSDSEDEEMEESSSDEEKDNLQSDENDDEEEEEGDITFQMF